MSLFHLLVAWYVTLAPLGLPSAYQLGAVVRYAQVVHERHESQRESAAEKLRWQQKMDAHDRRVHQEKLRLARLDAMSREHNDWQSRRDARLALRGPLAVVDAVTPGLGPLRTPVVAALRRSKLGTLFQPVPPPKGHAAEGWKLFADWNADLDRNAAELAAPRPAPKPPR